MNKAEVLNKLRGLVAEIESAGTVTWADEPRKLTPQEVALHLGNGGCISEGTGFAIIRLRKNLERYDFRDERWVEIEPKYSPSLIGAMRRQPCPDPSQPAKPPLKVGDWVKLGDQRGNVVWAGSGRVHVEFDGVGVPTAHALVDIEKIEEAAPAEPQPEYPLTYEEALKAVRGGAVISNEAMPNYEYWVYHGAEVWIDRKNGGVLTLGWDFVESEVKANWRIVEEKKSSDE